ncbi:Tyrosine-protein kinase [Dirofilaria immitis]
MDGRLKQISDSYIVKSSKITIGKDKIGTGNFADVYKGTYHKGKEEILVAVKIVRIGGGNMDNELHCLSELKNEAIIMSLHYHRCVIEFFGISSDKIPMILMEYCAGGSLDLHLQKFKERISTTERVMYMSEISNGMRYLERKGCIHRDLAARNILISNTGWLKISDFGLSLSSAVQMPKQTTTHTHIPVRWMAPETLTHTPIYSSKSDIWSFGIVMYEIFNCGRKPWPQKPVKWIATKIRKGVTPEMPKRMPRLVREIASACFQLEPDKRPTFRQVFAID